MHKARYVRFVVAALVLVAIFVGMQAHVVVGSLCVLCPVGFASVAAASGSVPWQLLPGVVALLLIVFLLGRVFCSWVCPTGALKNLFGGRAPRGVVGRAGEPPRASASAGSASDSGLGKPGGSSPSGCAKACGSGSKSSVVAQGVVFAVLLVVSFVVHFPVFCLICPIGLALGTLYAISRVFVLWTPGWELVVFPLMLLLEVFLFKRWCSRICPLGFFFGLAASLRSRLGFAVAPRVCGDSCRASEGCRACGTVCPEDIDVSSANPRDFEDCTLCLDCVGNCPTKSLQVKLSTGDGAPPRTSETSEGKGAA